MYLLVFVFAAIFIAAVCMPLVFSVILILLLPVALVMILVSLFWLLLSCLLGD